MDVEIVNVYSVLQLSSGRNRSENTSFSLPTTSLKGRQDQLATALGIKATFSEVTKVPASQRLYLSAMRDGVGL